MTKAHGALIHKADDGTTASGERLNAAMRRVMAKTLPEEVFLRSR